MTDRIHEYYKESAGERPPPGHFHKVIALHEMKELQWEALSKEIPLLQRGWFELSRLSKEDRIEFTRDYWFSKLSSSLATEVTESEKLFNFFHRLDDICLFATQEIQGAPFEVHMVYSLENDNGFFHGCPPANKEIIANCTKQFGNISFPKDYLAFLEIHDGFSKYTDTGLIKIRDIAKNYLRFQQLYAGEVIFSPDAQMVDPKSLIPFYESYALHCYQCFYADWYPASEMGNVYFAQKEGHGEDLFEHHYLDENFAFPSFLCWLVCYLEVS